MQPLVEALFVSGPFGPGPRVALVLALGALWSLVPARPALGPRPGPGFGPGYVVLALLSV